MLFFLQSGDARCPPPFSGLRAPFFSIVPYPVCPHPALTTWQPCTSTSFLSLHTCSLFLLPPPPPPSSPPNQTKPAPWNPAKISAQASPSLSSASVDRVAVGKEVIPTGASGDRTECDRCEPGTGATPCPSCREPQMAMGFLLAQPFCSMGPGSHLRGACWGRLD